jgi:hypothetical protein
MFNIVWDYRKTSEAYLSSLTSCPAPEGVALQTFIIPLKESKHDKQQLTMSSLQTLHHLHSPGALQVSSKYILIENPSTKLCPNSPSKHYIWRNLEGSIE